MARSIKDLKIWESSLFARKWNALVDEIERRTLHVVAPLYLDETISGTVLAWKRQRGGGGSGGTPTPATPCPFDMTLTLNGSDYDLTFYPGTINQYIPSNLLTTFTYTAGSTVFVKIHCTTNGKAVTGASIVVNGTPASPLSIDANAGSSSFDIIIGVIINNVAYKTIACGNISVILQQQFTEDKPSPSVGVSPYIRWYQWVISIIGV